MVKRFNRLNLFSVQDLCVQDIDQVKITICMDTGSICVVVVVFLTAISFLKKQNKTKNLYIYISYFRCNLLTYVVAIIVRSV